MEPEPFGSVPVGTEPPATSRHGHKDDGVVVAVEQSFQALQFYFIFRKRFVFQPPLKRHCICHSIVRQLQDYDEPTKLNYFIIYFDFRQPSQLTFLFFFLGQLCRKF